MKKEFIIIETYEIKPNYAYLADKYEITVKKYYEGYESKSLTRQKIKIRWFSKYNWRKVKL